MKLKVSLIICVFLIGLSGMCQDACGAYFPFKKGVAFQITNYDAKVKKEGVVDYKIIELQNSIATVQAKIMDAKGKKVAITTYDVTCYEDAISIDFKSMMNPEMFKQYKDMDIEMTGSNIEFPNTIKAGQTLKEAKFNLAIKMGLTNMNMVLNMLNRTVEREESVTTPAGTFKCFLISYDSEVNVGVKQSFKIKEWLAEGVGVVRTETYTKNGKLVSYSELTQLSN